MSGSSSKSRSAGLSLAVLVWLVALLPLLTTHLSFAVAASYQLVPWCNPYWDSCTSISATGRELPAAYIFRLGMIPAALLAVMVWWSLWRWLTLLGSSMGKSMPVLGTIAALSLILYTLALGEAGDSYRMLRRIGVVFAFALTYIAQVLLTRQVLAMARRVPHSDSAFQRFYPRMLAWQMVLLLIGFGSVVLDAVMGSAYDRIEDAIEWWLALLLNGYFVWVALLLHQEPVRLDVVDVRGPVSKL